MSSITTEIIDPNTGGKVHVTLIAKEWMASPLTTCCNASATGTENGPACRACYEEVDWEFGDCWTTERQIPAEIRTAVMAVVANLIEEV
jgi:hypothetical protein